MHKSDGRLYIHIHSKRFHILPVFHIPPQCVYGYGHGYNVRESITNEFSKKFTPDDSVVIFTASNENAVFSDNSIKGSGIVIYYQEAENYGFDTQYEALVYREVE